MQLDIQAAGHVRRILQALGYTADNLAVVSDEQALESARKLASAARAATLKHVPVPAVWPPPIVSDTVVAELKRNGYSEGYGKTYSNG